ncbi:DNA-processing protein DprA [Agromyces binzhouensis]|uniref:Smf/DprA SLOG domain-containing protein n=1 Tax=Agromyces binzhouensis TaxID=1817495 RepID=A0A4Q2JWQ0_9MICO|nr:DNA-processing protein DprA [Agromyces binzhouensis]RXZ51844.1 hypothetical protein ESO86_00385 [Agromyces binzhouensis]
MIWTSLRPSIPTTIPLDEDLEARLVLTHAGLSGNPAIGNLIEQVGGAAGVLDFARAGAADIAVGLPDGTLRRVACAARQGAAQMIADATEQHGLMLLTPERSGWPTRIDVLGSAAPLLLWIDGPDAVLADGIAAVVGPRHPDREARNATLEIATALADQGWVVAANDAPGVASLALRAATAMKGRNIQVVAAGVDQVRKADRLPMAIRVSPEAPTGHASARASRVARATLVALAERVFTVDQGRNWETEVASVLARALGRTVAEAPAQ